MTSANMSIEDFLFTEGYSKNDQKEGYILKVEEMIELIDKYQAQLQQHDVSVSVCTCKNPIIQRCVLTGVFFCMSCIKPVQTER